MIVKCFWRIRELMVVRISQETRVGDHDRRIALIPKRAIVRQAYRLDSLRKRNGKKR